MATRKITRQNANPWETTNLQSPGNSKSEIKTAKEIKMKSHMTLVDSPYMQPLLPLLSCSQRKPVTKGKSRINRPTISFNNLSKSTTNQYKEKGGKTVRQVQFPDQTFRPVTSLQCQITLKFVANYSTGFPRRSHRICVQQQHCGGTPVSVYQGWHVYGDTFNFLSRRKQGYPFSLTLFIDQILNLHLSSCCEYKYQHGCKLGGVKSQFILINVQGYFPCYRCQMRKNRTGGSITSTQSSDVSKTDDYQSQISNGRVSNDGDSHNSGYEDDFEEDDSPKTSPEVPLGLNDENCKGTEYQETELDLMIDKLDIESQFLNLKPNEETLDTKCDNLERLVQSSETDLINSAAETDNLEIYVKVPEIDEHINSEKNEKLGDSEKMCDTSETFAEFFDQVEEQSNSGKFSEPSCDNNQIENIDSQSSPIEFQIPLVSRETESKQENNVINDVETDESKDHHEEQVLISPFQKEKSFSDLEDDNSTNDDAERSVTSNTEFSSNSDTDEDVCYSYETTPVVPDRLYPSTLNDDFEQFSSQKLSVYQSGVRFDSSDEEECNYPPQITIWADVHACEIESPAINKLCL